MVHLSLFDEYIFLIFFFDTVEFVYENTIYEKPSTNKTIVSFEVGCKFLVNLLHILL